MTNEEGRLEKKRKWITHPKCFCPFWIRIRDCQCEAPCLHFSSVHFGQWMWRFDYSFTIPLSFLSATLCILFCCSTSMVRHSYTEGLTCLLRDRIPRTTMFFFSSLCPHQNWRALTDVMLLIYFTQVTFEKNKKLARGFVLSPPRTPRQSLSFYTNSFDKNNLTHILCTWILPTAYTILAAPPILCLCF